MKQKTDWDGLVRLWVTEKSAVPTLDMMSFFRNHGFTTKNQIKKAQHRIGRAMGGAWAAVRDRAMEQTQDLGTAALARTLQEVLRMRKSQIAIGLRKLIPQQGGPTDAKGNPIAQFQPANYEEADRTLDRGIKGITEIVSLCTGGEPMMPTQPRKVIFKFVPVAIYNRPERKKRTTKKG